MMQQYRLVLRTVGASNSVDGTVMNAEESMAQITDFYLGNGFSIVAVQHLGAFISSDGVPGDRFAYHMVKEIKEK
jgi:hypothetical protein